MLQMDNFQIWFADSPLASFLRVLLAVTLSQAVAHFASVGTFDLSNFQVWLIAGLVSALPTLLRWLNPQDGLS